MKKNYIITLLAIFMLLLDVFSPISSLIFVQANENKEIENIFTLEFFKVDGVDVEDNPFIEIEDDTQVSLRYNWEMKDHTAVAGDFSRITVPEAFIALNDYSGNLVVTVNDDLVNVGTYTLSKDTNLLEFVYNENIEDLDVELGFVEFEFDLNLEYFSQNVRQVISFNDSVNKEISVVVKPTNTSKTIDKVGVPDSYLDANTIVWTVDIYNNSQLPRNGFIRDAFDAGLNLDINSFVLIPFTLGLDGSVHVLDDQQQSLTSDAVVVGNSDFTVTIPEILAYSGYRLVYDTTFNDFEKLVFENTAEYVFGEEPALVATATVSGLTRSNVVEKRAIEIDEHEIQWIIDINKSNMNLSNASVLDTMDEMLSIVSDSITVVELNLVGGVWQPGDSYGASNWSYTIDNQNVSFSLGNIGEKAYRISYNTKIEYTGNYVAVNEFENNAILKNEEVPIGGGVDRVSITRSPLLSKTSVSNVTFDNKTLTWTIKVNEAKHPLGSVVVSDELPSGVSLVEGSIVIKNEAGDDVTGDFNSGITSTPSSFSIDLGNINTQTYTITYNTEITDFTINSFVNNASMTGVGIVGTVSTDSSTSPVSNSFSKSHRSTNYSDKTMSWRLVVRPTREAIRDLTIIDTYPNKGLTLVENSVLVTLAGATLVKDTDYTISYIDGSIDFKDGFKIVFTSGSYNNIIQIDYKTSFDPDFENGIDENITTNRVYKNKAQFVGTTVNNNAFDEPREAQTTLIEAAWFSGKKEGRLVHKNNQDTLINGWVSGFDRLIEWVVYTNYLEQTLEGPVVISDTLGYVGEIDSESVQLFEYTVKTNGTTVLSQTAIDSSLYAIVVDGDSMTITFAEGYNQRVAVVFLTTVDSLSRVNYTNNASVTIDTSEPLDYSATVTYQEYNDFLSKEEVFERADSNAFVDEEIEWEITLNESLSIINNAILVDTISTGMVLIEDSVEVFELINGVETEVVSLNNYEVTIDNNLLEANVATVLTIKFDETYEMNTAHVIRYKTVVVTNTGKISNSASFNGDVIQETTVESEELTANQLSFSGGIANTRLGSLIINKEDSVTDQALNATFELFYEINDEERIVGEGEFDVNGMLRIDNLSYRTYKLREKTTETGYVLLKEPIEIVLDSTTVNDSREINITVKNVQTLVLEKKGEVLGEKTKYDTVGDIIRYTITTTNTGEEDLSNVEIIDEMINEFVDGTFDIKVFDFAGNATTSSLVNGQIVLKPGDYVVLEGNYAVTQEDIDAGAVLNKANAKATYRDNLPIESEEDEVVVEAEQRPSIEIVKTTTTEEVFDKVGDIISYTFTVTNTGNVTLTNVLITDELVNDLQYLTINGVAYAGGLITLGPSDVLVAQATYAVQQKDIDAGEVLNIASVKGIDPNGQDVVDSDNEDVTGSQQPSIEIVKNVKNENKFTSASEIIEYEFIVTNTGNVTLRNVVITDDLIENVEYVTINNVVVDDQDNIVLRPNDILIARAFYAVTQQDMNALKIVNTASVKGTPPSGEDVEDEDEAIIEGESNPSISVVKEAVIHDINGIKTSEDSDVNYASLDEWVVYTIVATNSGNITLHNVEIVDDRDDLIDVSYVVKDEQDNIIETDVVNGQVSLDPNHSLVMVARLNITQQHIDDGVIENNASGIGYPQDPNNPESQPEDPVEDDDEANVVADQNSSLTLKKEVVNQSPYTQVGDLIEYRFVVENTGNTTLRNVRIIDELLDDLVYVSINGENIVDTSLPVNLKPKDVLYAIGEYRVRQKDVNAQIIENDAQAIGTTPNDEQVKDDDQATILGEYNPSISLSKEVTIYTKEDVIKQNQSAVEHISEYLMYEVISTNTGNITLHNVGIVDELEGLYDVSFVVVGEDNEVIDANTINNEVILQPNQSLIMRAKLDITQDILDQGFIDNQAFTNANPEDKDNPNQPSEEIVEDDDQESVGVNQTSEIRIVKEVLNTKNYSFKGEIITYQFTLTNTGNTTLSNVILEDDMIERFTSISLNGNAIAYTQDGFTLLSDDVLVIVGTYTVTQQDIEEGSIVNNAKVTATDINDEPLEDEDEAVIDADQKYDISLNKSNVVVNEQGVEVDQFSNENDQILYRIVVTNSGNMIKYNVVINDIMMNDLEDIQYIHYDFNNDVIATYSSESIQPLNLMPNEVLELKATYTIKSSDLSNGNIRNVASITYTDEDGEILGDSDDFTQSYGLTTINLLKVDEKDKSKVLEGAEFELTNVKTQQTFTVVTDAKGQATFSNLLFGEYTLKETKSPSGYALAEEEMIIVIDKENNTLVELTITNKETIADMSDSSYYVSAGLLLLLGMLLLLISKDKKVKQ